MTDNPSVHRERVEPGVFRMPLWNGSHDSESEPFDRRKDSERHREEPTRHLACPLISVSRQRSSTMAQRRLGTATNRQWHVS